MPLSSVLGAQSLVRPGVCTSTTRPASPFEGQTIYETDTDRLATWDGSAWIPYVRQTAGKVLQVVSTTKTDTFVSSSISAGATADITGLTATITPTSTSSTVLVLFSVYGQISISGGQRQTFSVNVYRGSTQIAKGDAAGSRSAVTGHSGVIGVYDALTNNTAMFLDSPATTSATTYKLAAVNTPLSNVSGTMYVNRTVGDTDANHFARTASFITVMEISG